MNKRRYAVALAVASVVSTAGIAVATPAQAACDTMSVGKPYKSGSYVRANASVCANVGWVGYASIQRKVGVVWDTVATRRITAAGTGTTVQGPVSWNCSGRGTQTYRGRIHLQNGTIFTGYEYSAQSRFSC